MDEIDELAEKVSDYSIVDESKELEGTESEDWKAGVDSSRWELHNELLTMAEEEAFLELRRQVEREFMGWEKAGISDGYATHELEKGRSYRATIIFGINSRSDFVRNQIKVKIEDLAFQILSHSTEDKLNTLYGNVRKTGATQALLPPASARAGLPVVVFDRSVDFLGRFHRALIVKVGSRESGQPITVICDLIDRGKRSSFPLDQVYVMVKIFTQVPPEIITIQLHGLKRFAGLPKLGLVAETTLLKYRGELKMRCEGVENKTAHMILHWPNLMESLNELILRRLCERDPRDINDFRNMVNGREFEKVHVTDFTQDGRIFIRPTSRIQLALSDALEDATENFEVYNALFKSSDIVYLALHPVDRTALRCVYTGRQPLNWNIENLEEEFVKVMWIDRGGVSKLRMSDLVPAGIISRILVIASPQAFEVQLANVRKIVKISKSDIYALLPQDRIVTLRVLVDGLGYHDSIRGLPIVEVIIHHDSGVKPKSWSLNNKLIREGFAETAVSLVKFTKERYLILSGLAFVDMTYTCIEWAADRGFRFERETIAVGDQITFYISHFSSTRDFKIHPWYSKDDFEMMELGLTRAHTKHKWIQMERLAEGEGPLKIPPNGPFCIYSKKDKFYRARVLGRNYDSHGQQVYGENGEDVFVDLLVIDTATQEKAPCSALWKMFPATRVMMLGPQGALAKFSDNDCSGLTKAQLCGKISATVDAIDIMQSGLAIFTLSEIITEQSKSSSPSNCWKENDCTSSFTSINTEQSVFT